jgi:diguanylate cyclase (GGDEF)-like protein
VAALPLNRRAKSPRKRRIDVESSIGSVMLFGGAAASVVAITLPHSPDANEGGYLLMAAVLATLAALMPLAPARARSFIPGFTVFIGIAASAIAVCLNGEANGGAPLLNEMYLLWPILYVGYFVRVRWTVAALVWCAAAYISALAYLGLPLEATITRAVVVLSVLGGTAAVMRALRNHVDRLVSRLHALARTDALTGLLNRRAFDERLQQELDRAARTKTPFALLLGDIDHFKALNDRHGHAAGDAALEGVGSVFAERSRTMDTAARVGGEEFALLLPGTTLAGGLQVAERLRAALRERDLTMSFGVVEGPAHGSTADDLLRTADRALYAAKASGRDRTVAPDEATARAAA